MSFIRMLGFSSLLVATVAPAVIAADDSTRLLQSVPAGAPFVMHVRSVDAIKAEFARSPYARLWAEPEVKAFFAPATTFLESPEAQDATARFESITGHAPVELLGLFTGESVLSVLLSFDGAGEPLPEVVFGGSVGANRAKLEAALKKAGASTEAEAAGSVVSEELQGEMIHTFMAKGDEDAAPEERVSWALVDDVLWLGYPKAAVQGAVARFKSGGAPEPVTTAAGFAPIYGRNPKALGVYYLDLESIVRTGLTAYQAYEASKKLQAEAAKTDEDGEESAAAQPSMLEQMGVTPDVIVRALGADALRSIYMVSLGGEAMTIEGGLTWTEQRGLLKMFAFGAPPAPQPTFVAPSWSEVSTMRFQPAGVWEAIKDAARTANPMFEFMLAQQLASLKQQTGIDVEKDFFGAFGDETVIARTFLDDVTAGINGTEQLWSMSLANAEAFGRVIDTALAMVPNGAQMFEEREYLGHKIRSITAPLPGQAGQLLTISFAITPSHLFLDLGGSGMIETSIQRLDGGDAAFWTQPSVVSTLKDLPGGAVGVSYQNAGETIHQAFLQFAQMARVGRDAGDTEVEASLDEEGRPIPPPPSGAKRGGPGLDQFINPDAVPSRETVARHLGTTATGIYLDADGIRFRAQYKNAP